MTKLKTSIMLRKAKKHLSTGCASGICNALSSAHGRTKRVDELQSMIMCRLGVFAYATSWLAAQVLGIKKNRGLTRMEWNRISRWKDSQKVEDLQRWRHEWLDLMIAEFESKGD